MAWTLLASTPAYAQSSTRASLQCRGGTSAEVALTLTLNGQALPNQFGQTTTTLTCGPGQMMDAIDIITRMEPNDWHVQISVTGPGIGTEVCEDDGTSFPAMIECPENSPPEDSVARIGRPHRAPGPGP